MSVRPARSARSAADRQALLPSQNPVPRWQRLGIDSSLYVLLATGAIWLLAHYLVGAGNTEIGLPHPSEAWLMRLHAFAGWTATLAVGAFLPLHVPRGWRTGSRRVPAIVLLVTLALALASAYVLGYLVSEPWRPATGWGHALAGALAVGALLVHRRRTYHGVG
jgi:hypothetical protein